MKVKHLFLAAIVALGMMACNNEDAPQVIEGAEATVSVKVVPSSNGPAARLVGDLEVDGLTAKGLAEEYAVKKTQVWIFGKDAASLIGYGEANGDEVKNIPALAVESDILVVVNGGELGLSASTSRNDLENVHATIPTDVAGKGLAMTGQVKGANMIAGANTIGYNTDNVIQEAALKVTRVNARVGLVNLVIDPTTEQQVLFDGLSNLEVAMFNVPKESKIFGDAGSLAEMASFLYGASGWDASYETGNTLNSALTNSLSALPTNGKNAAYYYVTENTNAEEGEEMILVLRGKPTLGEDGNGDPINVNYEGIYTDTNGYTYFPVRVNITGMAEADAGAVVRNTQYNIHLTIKGIGNPGIDEVDKAWLDVKVVVQDWAQVDQNVEWK